MVCGNPSPLVPPNLSPGTSPSLWSRESPALKQGIKTGLAGTLTYAIYTGFNLPQGYWAVFAALVVTQANLGASWKAALYRMIGSTAGALAAAFLIPLLGTGSVRAGIALFLLASFFGYLTALHPSFSAAGFTAALILVFGGQGEPWHMAWLRVLYTLLGAFIAFAVGALIWPVRARQLLRLKIADILDGARVLYLAITAAAIDGVDNEDQVRQLDRELHDLRRGVTQQMDEARNELAFSRFNAGVYQGLVDLTDSLRRRLTAMAEDSAFFVGAQFQPQLVPSLPAVVEQTATSLLQTSQSIRARSKPPNTAGLDAAVEHLDADLARLRQQRATSPLTLDRMLPFWALIFNLKEIVQDLKQLERKLLELG